MELFTQMDLPLLALIIVLIILAALSIGAGAVSYGLQERSSKRESQADSSKHGQRAKEQQRPDSEIAGATSAQTEPALRPEDYLPAHPGEVMRVLRDEMSGALVIEVEGQRYHRLADIRDGRVGRRVVWAIAGLLRFTEGVSLESVARSAPAVAGAPSPDSQAERMPDTSQPPSPAVPAEALTATEEKFLRRLKEEGLAETEGRRGKAAKPVTKPRTFVDEIEDILQEFIRESVVPVDKSVHVHTGSDGALEIEVGGQVYESPDDVPDPIVRGLIKAAVDEWERR
jgi:hypothetical protein